MFRKVLIANRGEIAVRVIRACKEMGMRTVAVYSDVDADSLHVRLADEAFPLGAPEPTQSYLNTEKILEIAERSGAEAIHPGYGFLAENPEFIEACEGRGIVFIGPPSGSIRKAKPKHKARQLARRIGVPVTPGSENAIEIQKDEITNISRIAEEIGYPLIVKPIGAGGGIGMKVVRDQDELLTAAKYAQNRGLEAFGISAFYLEKYLPRVRHIEFQVLADKKGNIVHLGERECSIQRRFQKVLEEAPSPALSQDLRAKMGDAAIKVAKALDYVNSLTVEFLYIPYTGDFYFNEVNCRLQVEHCVTELITGIDIVKEQMRIAAGEELGFTQSDIRFNGWALECRINAEDPLRDFFPSPGRITTFRPPRESWVRVDEGIYEGCDVPIYYDPLILKLSTWGESRAEALSRMYRAVRELSIEGIRTNIPFHKVILQNGHFGKGDITTNFVAEKKIVENIILERLFEGPGEVYFEDD